MFCFNSEPSCLHANISLSLFLSEIGSNYIPLPCTISSVSIAKLATVAFAAAAISQWRGDDKEEGKGESRKPT